ncbi:DUF5131 family protein [Gemmata sp.]|uniref:DUF5131 family protein n=1 Tax=Gemmata sp. TaxID=1914242 RepID=UPI003F70E195
MTIQFHEDTGNRGIEWCDETRNPTGGCLHGCRWVMPDGTIANCYAGDLAEHGVAAAAYPNGFRHHYWRPHELRQLGAEAVPRLIFSGSMSDMFAPAVPAEQVHAILDALRGARHHAYHTLTKAAPQLLKYTDRMPPNLWVGVSSPPDWFMGRRLTRTQQEAMLRTSMKVLAEVRRRTGNLVWMSAEPLSWDLAAVIGSEHPLDWAVIGAASNGRRTHQPDPAHVENLLRVLDGTGTPVFFKGNLGPTFASHDFGEENRNRWREDFPMRYRDGREIPAVAEGSGGASSAGGRGSASRSCDRGGAP